LTIVHSFNIRCSYFTNDWFILKRVYGCDVQNNLTTTSRETLVIESVTGSHNSGYKDADVTALYLKDKGINHFPNGLQHVFENIKALSIQNDKIKEIHQVDLKFLPKLILFEIYKNEIEVVKDNIFAYNKDLQYINLSGNKIIHIGLQVFGHLKKLTYLKLSLNPCIDKEALDNTTQAMQIVEDVRRECYNFDYLAIDRDLQKLEDSLVCVNSETSSIFGQQLQNLENKVKTSKIPLPSVHKEKLKEISTKNIKNFWNSKQKLEEIENLLTTSKIETSKLMNNLTNSFNDIKRSENSLDLTLNSIKKDQQGRKIIISKVKSTLDKLNLDATEKSQAIDRSLKEIQNEVKLTQKFKIFNPEALNQNVQLLENYLKNSNLSCPQKQQELCKNSLKPVLDSIKVTQTDLINEVAALSKSLDILNKAMSLKSENIGKIIDVIKDDIKKSLADLTSSQVTYSFLNICTWT